MLANSVLTFLTHVSDPHTLQVLSEQIISNESRIARTKVIVNFNKPRQMQFTFLVRYEDFTKVEAICSDMKDHLLNTEGIHRQLPMWVGFTGVEGNACNVYTIVSPAAVCNAFSSTSLTVASSAWHVHFQCFQLWQAL